MSMSASVENLAANHSHSPSDESHETSASDTTLGLSPQAVSSSSQNITPLSGTDRLLSPQSQPNNNSLNPVDVAVAGSTSSNTQQELSLVGIETEGNKFDSSKQKTKGDRNLVLPMRSHRPRKSLFQEDFAAQSASSEESDGLISESEDKVSKIAEFLAEKFSSSHSRQYVFFIIAMNLDFHVFLFLLSFRILPR